MRIGLDMDDTICSTNNTARKYVDNYCKDKSVKPEEIWINEILKQDFLINNLEKIYTSAPLKENAKNVINKLKEDGNEIIIITARSDKYVNTKIEKLIEKYLNTNGITVDKIIINAKDKVDACKEYKIDLMLEDNLYNYNSLVSSGVTAALYDEENQHEDINNRIVNWKQLIDFTKKLI